MKKIISLILTLTLVLCSFTGCTAGSLGTLAGTLLWRLQNHTQAIYSIPYELDDGMISNFHEKLEAFRQAGAGTDADAASKAADVLDAAYMDIYYQYQIAYVYYCLDTDNDVRGHNYMESVQVLGQAETDYNAALKELYLEKTPVFDTLFGDWTQQEIENLLYYTPRAQQLSERNTQIVMEYQQLPQENFAEGMVPLYNEMVQNYNELAAIYGYDNYYEFAHCQVYRRDYELSQLDQLRQNVADYVPLLCERSLQKRLETYRQLNEQELQQLKKLQQPYTGGKNNPVTQYIEILPDPAQQCMQEAFDDRIVFNYANGGYSGAYTLRLADGPFCYFSGSYSDNYTIIHELGHYYGLSYAPEFDQPMDLAETQSQGNEWLFTHSLCTELSENAYVFMSEGRIASELSSVLLYCLVDRFEQLVYTSDHAGNMTLSEYDGLMEQVIEEFGGEDAVGDYIGDVQNYWKCVVVESPVYYISYAVSGLAAMELYLLAENDTQAGLACYRSLIEQQKYGFSDTLTVAGLSGPFSGSLFENLQSRYEK